MPFVPALVVKATRHLNLTSQSLIETLVSCLNIEESCSIEELFSVTSATETDPAVRQPAL